ncbi:arsenate reductase (glutaredoxin) [Flavisphingomonas formosensis]|uniref:arsenate reductase (glutaredoxin) n=1 Tax=Flavisphingomonas formosensis TaxID=861534 RepID=UPI0012F8161A|nr:arsenate reductase (glutaredoxin) [Sphingomonas formosensis]
MKATIFHNPRCSTSRKTLALLQERPGLEIEVIDYLKTPPSREKLKALYAKAGITPRQGLRAKEDLAKEMNLASASDDGILDAMAANPILIERPIVETAKGVRLGRPPENVLEVL